MYAIFSGRGNVGVRPCKVEKIEKDGFVCQCHNGGDGLEFFSYDDIGKNVFFSKDSAQIHVTQKR